MPSCVNDIIETGHYIKVAIAVKEPCIACSVVSRCFLHILFEEGLVIVVESAHKRRGHG